MLVATQQPQHLARMLLVARFSQHLPQTLGHRVTADNRPALDPPGHIRRFPIGQSRDQFRRRLAAADTTFRLVAGQ